MTAVSRSEESIFDSLLDRADVARALGTTPRLLNFLLFRISSRRRYRRFKIKKRSGGTRTIRAPIPPLRQAQSRFATLLDARYQPRSCVFGYVKSRSIQMNAACHVGKRWVLRVDLKDFFPSINFGRVRGMLLAKPFSLPPSVATTLAQLSCHENELPQGSPASPVLSNLICRGLDGALAKLAREQRCSYTRYCDDLVFSTNRRAFPAVLAAFDPSRPLSVTLGSALQHEIERAGFTVNAAKVRLCPSSQRQMVTGLIANVRINVPRKFIGDLRMILHVWRKLGTDAAASWYLSKHDKRNRPPGKGTPSFNYIVRGKVQYLGSVRGWSDPTYVRLGQRLAALDPTFRLTTKTLATQHPTPTLHVYVEGKTDKMHIDTALKSMQSAGRFKNLRIEIEDKDRGSQELLKLCRSFSERLQTAPCVFVFDSDERNVIPQVTDSNGDTKDWGNGVYSFVIARPPHRANDDRLCIELLYADADLRRADDAGRRLFRGSEFRQPSGRHVTLDAYTTTPNKSSLVVEDNVFDFAEKKLCLSKSGFTTVIRKHAASVNFDGFGPVFDQLAAVHKRITDGGS
jgi:RNA-directed DNA polymerase